MTARIVPNVVPRHLRAPQAAPTRTPSGDPLPPEWNAPMSAMRQ